jgi:hypothetical protein
MLMYDGVFKWKGWGGKLSLGKGSCHLILYDRTREQTKGLAHLRPIVAIVRELPGNSVSVRAFSGHIATSVVEQFDLDPHRLLWIEYTPGSTYGRHNEHTIPERYDAVEFTWEGRRALSPRWETLKPPALDMVREIAKCCAKSTN